MVTEATEDATGLKERSCACGYKEKLEAFQTRRKKEGAGVSKRDVAKYLKQQQKQEEPFNNPFAAALAKMEQEKK